MRDNGQYWPSICHYASSPCICADYSEQTRRLFVGLLQGTITEYEVNSLSLVARYECAVDLGGGRL